MPLILLLVAAYAPDLIEMLFDRAGHHNREISHSLVSVVFGATILALAYVAFARDARGAVVVWLTYGSHWAADFFTGSKPTWPGGPQLGLMWYSHPVRDAVMECGLILVCWIVYWYSLSSVARTRWWLWLVPALLIAAQIGFDMHSPTLDFKV